VINQIRGFLLERSIIVRQGLRFLRQALPDILAKRTDVLSPRMWRTKHVLANEVSFVSIYSANSVSPLLPIVSAGDFRLSSWAPAISARSAANGRRPQRQFDNPFGEKGHI
jgi:hypothetical protein